jgi:hypothetical protein
MVTSLSPAETLSPPTGGSGFVEVPPPQAVKKSAEVKANNEASNETRIECKNMNFSCAEPLDPKF